MPATRLSPKTGRTPSVVAPLPAWLQRTLAYGAAVVVVGVAAWLLWSALLKVGLVVFALIAALLLTALLTPLAERLRRAGAPSWLAALVSIVLLVGVPVGVAFLVYRRVQAQLAGLGPAVTSGLDQLRNWLVSGPLNLDPSRVQQLRTSAVNSVQEAIPSAVAGTTTIIQILTGVLLVVFAVFFLVKDGPRMWTWALRWVPQGRRDRFDGGGRAVFGTLSGYVRGTLLVALVDAVGIGGGLLLLGVPVWLSLTLLTFLGAFVPLIGATVAGGVAVLVTLVTNGFTDALIVLVIVLAVQQLEGNVLQPLIMGTVVRLHPLAIVSVVTAGTLLLGIAGAVIAVPLTAAAYVLVAYLSDHDEHVEEEHEEERDEGLDPARPETAAQAHGPDRG